MDHPRRGRQVDRCSGRPHEAVDHLPALYRGRCGEALWLDWRDVNLAKAHVTFGKTKNGEARGVPLHPRVIAALANIKHKSGEVFRRPDGKPYARPRSINDTSAGSRIKNAFAGAVEGLVSQISHPTTADTALPRGIIKPTAT